MNYFKFLAFLLYIAISLHIQNVTTQFRRIIGGLDAEFGEYPYQVSLQASNIHFCGGSIISSFWILSAAHCANDELFQTFSVRVYIVVGTNSLKEGGDFYHAIQYKVHEHYNAENWANDIAVIRPNKEIMLTSLVLPVKLASVNPPDNFKVVLTGWGLTMYRPFEQQPTLLQHIHLRTLYNAECANRLIPLHEHLHDDDICTFQDEYQGACKGDSGGPLVEIRSGLQIGVVSWGIPCAIGRPDIFTSVVYHRSWIFFNTGV